MNVLISGGHENPLVKSCSACITASSLSTWTIGLEADFNVFMVLSHERKIIAHFTLGIWHPLAERKISSFCLKLEHMSTKENEKA